MISFINEVSGNWFSYVIDSSIQLAIFSGVIFLLSYFFRNRSANFLYGLWLLPLLKAILPPALPLPFQKQIDFIPYIYNPTYPVFEDTTTTMAVSTPTLQIVGILFLAWCLVVLFLLGFILFKNTYFRLKLRHAEPFKLNLLPSAIQKKIADGTSFSVFVLDHLYAPFTINILRPKIYLPSDSLKWDAKKLEAILMHEIAHICRNDLLVNLFQNVVQVFYFFHPIVWLTNWQLNNYRERACDDYAIVHLNGYSLEYSKYLLAHLDRSLRVREYPALVNYFFQNKRFVMKRFECLVQKKEEIMLHFKPLEKVWLMLLLLVAFGFTLANSGITHALPDNLQDQNKKDYAIITGKITDKISKEAIPGVNIILIGTELGAVSDPSGNYEIKNIPPGKYQIFAQMLGYKEEAENLTVESTKEDATKYMLDFQLERTKIDLKPDVPSYRETNFTTKVIKPDPGYGQVLGMVYSVKTGEPLPGANVVISGTKLGSATDPGGKFVINNVPPGLFSLEARYLGFTSVTKENIEVKSDLFTHLDFSMSVDHVENITGETEQEKDLFVDYDTPPEPIGGFAAIQKNLIYPEIARRAGIEGMVVVRVLIAQNGEVIDTNILKSLGENNGCAEAAVEAISKTAWEPAKQKNQPVQVWVSVPVQFTMKDTESPPPQHEGPIFVPYDKPPEPIGGFTAIQNNLDYPELARRAGIQGMAILQVLIDSTGQVKDTKVTKSMGQNNGCDEAAVTALSKTTWKPAMQKDKPITGWVSIPVMFKLKEQAAGLGKIIGVVKDENGNPIKQAMVFIQDSDFKEYTNDEGAYKILNVQLGEHQLICGTPDLNSKKDLMAEMKKLEAEMENPEKRDAMSEKMKELSTKMRELQFAKKEEISVKVEADKVLEINIILR